MNLLPTACDHTTALSPLTETTIAEALKSVACIEVPLTLIARIFDLIYCILRLFVLVFVHIKVSHHSFVRPET